jgi:carboxyl-terminal processing protease
VSLFKTKSGRVVSDGGGITPDFSTETIYLSSIAQSLITKQLIFDYATLYRNQHASIAPARSFRITEKDFQDFTAWLAGKEYDYTTKSEKSLEELKETAVKEKYYDGMKDQFDLLKKSLMHDKQADLAKNKDEIMQLLQDEIASRYYYQKGRIEAAFDYDPEIIKAVEALKDKTVFTAIMNRNPQEVIKK